MKKTIACFICLIVLAGCVNQKNKLPVIGFIDAFEDNTLQQARQGFLDALKQNGFDEKKGSIKIIYKNAQGDIPALIQIVNYMKSQQVKLIATCPTLSTISAIQNNKKIPVFMMVASTPKLMKLNDAAGNPPANLFGTGEELDYIDSSFLLMPALVQPKSGKLRVGMIYNQSEPQSVDAIQRIQSLAAQTGIELVYESVNSSADAQLITQSILSKKIDVFFANPDNVVFSAFETIVNACEKAAVPVFTSESGLVARGAVVAYGADLYQWGFQTGLQAAEYLKNSAAYKPHWELVKKRIHVYNPAMARKFNIQVPKHYQALP
jgi:putative ABC transport system substrate-binding protein